MLSMSGASLTLKLVDGARGLADFLHGAQGGELEAFLDRMDGDQPLAARDHDARNGDLLGLFSWLRE